MNGKESVSEHTRERIRIASEELRFSPSPTARRLSRNFAYYAALDRDDHRYIAARAIQQFARGHREPGTVQ
jgi:DNA-binding LacI/PurR family transcriptional regulator